MLDVGQRGEIVGASSSGGGRDDDDGDDRWQRRQKKKYETRRELERSRISQKESWKERNASAESSYGALSSVKRGPVNWVCSGSGSSNAGVQRASSFDD